MEKVYGSFFPKNIIEDFENTNNSTEWIVEYN